ncbi:hypothetical protein R5W24_004983 [Gemmata sp. JC717]|uniref:hypothetical protein n=1 Tax=Gemmata algarum TaxID=2975278 RepID=UPI0021BAD08F|nr:hypothetical protein [Gemmata algarum]MDY3555837.1 hypothetical protein [Gemmata algarum]
MAGPSRKWWETVWAAGAAGKRPDWADLEWYAVDDFGRVGTLSTAGPGPVPRAVFRDLDSHLMLSALLADLPRRSKPKPELFPYPGEAVNWRRAAERGLYAYDYVYGGKEADGYRLVARPAVPLSLDVLPEWAREYLAGFRLRGESFPESAGRVLEVSRVRGGLVS